MKFRTIVTIIPLIVVLSTGLMSYSLTMSIQTHTDSNTSSLVEVNHLINGHSVSENTFIVDDLVYLADGPDGLKIINMSDPNNPVLIGNFDTYDALGIYVNNSLAFIADGEDGLKVINVSNPMIPRLVGTYSTHDTRDVWVNGTYAFLADRQLGLVILEVSDLSRIRIAGIYNTIQAATKKSGTISLISSNTLSN